MLTFKIQDKDLSKRTKDDNGYLIIKDNPIAKAGVFEYLLSELKEGISENDDRVVKVYRPFDELVKIKDTFANKPIKFNHVWVGEEDNKADGAIGSIISVDKDNLMLKADLIIYNPDLINAIENDNLVELSPGYTGEEEEQAGRFNGEDYEFIQKVVCVNHLAVVDRGRSGRDLKIQDSLKLVKEYKEMKKKFKDSFMNHIKKYFDEDEVAKTRDEDEIEAKQDDDAKVCDEDKREIIKEIMAVANKPADDFEGGEDERERTIAELAEKLAYNPSEESKTDDEDTEQDKTQDDELNSDNGDDISPSELAEAVAEVTEAIVEKKLNEFQDRQRKELKKISDTYAKVSDALGTSFDYRGMSVNDIYKFGYEALSGNALSKGMDAMTAFTMASQSKRSQSKFNDSAYKKSNSNISKLLEKY
ncbi:hypothetical protein OIBDGNHJ_00021 [Campylobacter phage PC22]|nr:hypothetical protein OIBDGNHJ_00021 [Campylobacter phage PC22]WAK44802.1 hypothetical protein GEEDAMGG_00037 [Campylobacter phage PC11]